MISKLSRNAPCPCDSRKKYKMCCMRELTKSQEEYYGLLHMESVIREKLVIWTRHNFDDEELDEYAYEFNKLKFDEIIDDEDVASFFDWFFLEALHKGKNKKMLSVIVDTSDLFDSNELTILNEWINNTQSGIFEIESIKKDNWKIILREIFTNKMYEVTDRKASENAIKDDIIFARVQKIFSNYYMSAAAINYPRFMTLNALKDFIKYKYNIEKQVRPNITYEEFMNSNSKVLNEFKIDEPKFVTAEGEEVKFCEVTYLVDLNHIEEILSWFANEEGFLITDEKYKEDKFKSANIACVRKSRKIADGDRGNHIINSDYINSFGKKISTEASIDIKGDKLKIFTQSEKVLKRLTTKLNGHIGRYIKLKKEDIKSVDDALQEFHEKPESKRKEKNRLKPELESSIMEQYYKEWCYQKIPALGNKTPKESIRTRDGREMLKKLLIDFENHEQHRKREEGKYIHVEKIIRKELNFYEE